MNLQEQISRIQSMMGVISEKLDDIKGTPLYHKTSTETGIKIINSDSLIGTKPSDEYLNIDKRLNITDHDIEEAVLEGARTLLDVQKKLKVGVGDPESVPEIEQLIKFYFEKYYG